MSRQASTVFKSHMKGANFMTPESVAHGFIGRRWVYEISTGTDFLNQPMWGVTVIDAETGALQREMGELVTSKQAAYELVEILKEGESK